MRQPGPFKRFLVGLYTNQSDEEVMLELRRRLNTAGSYTIPRVKRVDDPEATIMQQGVTIDTLRDEVERLKRRRVANEEARVKREKATLKRLIKQYPELVEAAHG